MNSSDRPAFRIAALPADPYVLPCFTEYPKGCPLPGTEILPLIKIFEINQIPFNLVNPGNIFELQRQVSNGEVDVLGATEALIDLQYEEYLQPR